MARQLAHALQAADAVKVCPVHPSSLKPCDQCERAFDRAERQRTRQLNEQGKRLHAEWLAKRGRA